MKSLFEVCRKMTVLVVLLTLCSTSLANSGGAAGNLSNEEKLYGLSLLWKEAGCNFAHFEYVPGLDWDKTYQQYIPQVLTSKSTEEYYRVLKKFYALLNHHHTLIIEPEEVRENCDEPKVKLVNIQRQAIVADTAKSLEKSVPIGSRIIKVDNIPINDYLRKHKFPYISHSREEFLWETGIIELLKGKKDTSVNVTIVTPDNVTKNVKLVRNSKAVSESWIRSDNTKQRFEFEQLENNIAYMALNSFGDDGIISDFKKKIPELKKCRGLIIDLRKNGGGMAMVTTTVQMYADGRKNRDGVRPDIEIHPTVRDIIKDRDPVLEKAIEILNEKLK